MTTKKTTAEPATVKCGQTKVDDQVDVEGPLAVECQEEAGGETQSIPDPPKNPLGKHMGTIE